MMTISIIIPAYNVECYIRRCLDSVISQACDDFNIECVIVDDASTDGTMGIVKEIIDGYEGASIVFKVLHHIKNEGLCSARNTGIHASSGDFVFFLDSDDDIFENGLKCLYSFWISFPYVDVVMGEAMEMEKDHQIETVASTQLFPVIINDKNELWEKLLRRRVDRHVWNKLVRRSLIVDNNLFFDVGLLYEDVIWTYKLFSIVSSILIVPQLSYLYEFNPTSVVHSVSKRPNQYVRSFTFICDYIINHPPIIEGNKVLYVAHRLFIFRWMLMATDIQGKYGTDTDVARDLHLLKCRLLWDAVRHLRPIVSLYFLIMFAPFKYLLKSRLFRSNIHKIDQLVYKIGF